MGNLLWAPGAAEAGRRLARSGLPDAPEIAARPERRDPRRASRRRRAVPPGTEEPCATCC
jgi:hypothetical protein